MLLKRFTKLQFGIGLCMIMCVGYGVLRQRLDHSISAEAQIVIDFKSISPEVIYEINAILRLKKPLPMYAYVLLLNELNISPHRATAEVLSRLLTKDVIEQFALGCLSRGMIQVQDLKGSVRQDHAIISRPWLCILRNLKIALQLSHMVSPEAQSRIIESINSVSYNLDRIIAEDFLYEYKITRKQLKYEVRSKRIATKMYNEFLSLRITSD